VGKPGSKIFPFPHRHVPL